jgi:predicted RNase H-like HicB family nuclease
MKEYFPVVIEREDNGTYSAWVAGLPGVYAAADTAAVAKRSLKSALAAHLATLRELGRTPKSKAEVAVLRLTTFRRLGATRDTLRYAGLGALLGRQTSQAKAAAARRNGRRGGRPSKTRTERRAR